MEGQELATLSRYDMTETAMSMETVTKQVTLIQQIMQRVMKKDEHYGVIPGCQKPSLLKPGAEKLSLTFRLSPAYEVIETNFEGGHREYRVNCTLTHIPTGQVFGQGVGICSTLETKYRYRGGEKIPTGQAVPKEYWNNKDKALIGGDGFGVAKIDGSWQICEIGEKMENPDIADTYNTVLKMAKKRAHVDAVLTATAASDIFTQDVEDMSPESLGQQGQTKTETQKPPIAEPQKKATTSNDAISENQLKAISSILSKQGITDDLAKHEKVAKILGLTQTPTSFKGLTKSQASTVIETLSKETAAA